MSMFRLVYDDADVRARRPAVALEAEHAAEVLAYLDDHYARRPVELWRDGECLGHIKRVNDHGARFWRVTA
jgi:hypothetical protein